MHICLAVLLISAGAASAHSGNRVFPFYELTDEMLEKIDIHDGLIDEWYEIGEPSMTMLDFKTFRDSVPLDPSNLDARIWLAWHDISNRIYAALVVADDKYYNTHNHNEDGLEQWMDFSDSAVFFIDGNHDGGRGEFQRGDEETVSIHGRTQRYSVIAETVSGPTLDNYIRGNQAHYTGTPSSWKIHPPYGDAGGAAAGEQPAVSVIEMYVTPYDWWGAWDDIDQTGFSELSANQTVGFVIVIVDQDRDLDFDDCSVCQGKYWYPAEIELDLPESWGKGLVAADLFVDGLLLPARSTAVESITWGRIKASLQK